MVMVGMRSVRERAVGSKHGTRGSRARSRRREVRRKRRKKKDRRIQAWLHRP